LTIRNSNYRLPGKSPARDSSLHTACVSHQPWRARWLPAPLSRAKTGFVVGKNYRLQDIQLSKTRVKLCASQRAVEHPPSPFRATARRASLQTGGPLHSCAPTDGTLRVTGRNFRLLHRRHRSAS
jgi:hypothetical protein